MAQVERNTHFFLMNKIESVHCHHVVPGLADAFRARYVRPSALMIFLEEAAAEHCRAVGRDIFDLLERGWAGFSWGEVCVCKPILSMVRTL